MEQFLKLSVAAQMHKGNRNIGENKAVFSKEQKLQKKRE